MEIIVTQLVNDGSEKNLILSAASARNCFSLHLAENFISLHLLYTVGY